MMLASPLDTSLRDEKGKPERKLLIGILERTIRDWSLEIDQELGFTEAGLKCVDQTAAFEVEELRAWAESDDTEFGALMFIAEQLSDHPEGFVERVQATFQAIERRRDRCWAQEGLEHVMTRANAMCQGGGIDRTAVRELTKLCRDVTEILQKDMGQ